MIQPNTIYNEDCLETMKRMPDNFLDLTVTSPPYDNLRDYKGYSFDFESIAKDLFRVTKKGGVVVWVVGDATIKGSETGTSFKQALYFFEYMFVFSKGKPKTFNPILEQCKTSGAYTHRRNTGRAVESSTRNRDEITITRPTKYKGNVFEYVIGSKKGGTGNHTAPFPEKLAEDHILSWSNEGDTVYDPFMGSGTTAKMAKLLNRNYIGSEISSEYCEIIKKRLAQQTLL
jgi:site-specific DNA-methyltransferase (adenine-specific)